MQNIEVTQEIEELEETIQVMRETRIGIIILKETKVFLFRERYVKKMYSNMPIKSQKKNSIDIRAPTNQEIGNFIIILNPTLMRETQTEGS